MQECLTNFNMYLFPAYIKLMWAISCRPCRLHLRDCLQLMQQRIFVCWMSHDYNYFHTQSAVNKVHPFDNQKMLYFKHLSSLAQGLHYIYSKCTTSTQLNKYWLTFTVIFMSIGLAVICGTGTRCNTQKRHINFLQATSKYTWYHL